MRLARQAVVLIAGAAALLVTGADKSHFPSPDITNPSWRLQPSPEYPAEALLAGVREGMVSLRCFVEPDGTTSACEALSEEPAGYGFATAAISAALEARLNPRQVDGVATGASITFTTTFAMSNEPYAMIGCFVVSSGALDGCRVLDENPIDAGLGAIALDLVNRARVSQPSAEMLESGVLIAVEFEGENPILPRWLELRDSDQPAVITNPSWVARPSPEYPLAAAEANVREGTVSLRCFILPSGAVADCTIISETPPGQGFGEAALRSAAAARLNPRSVDGAATGATVTFTVRFMLTDDIAPDFPLPHASGQAAFDCELLETGAFTDCRLAGANPFDDAWADQVTAIIARANFGRPRNWTPGMRRTLVFGQSPSGEPVALEIR